MSSLEILAYPNPFLRKEASTVTLFNEGLKKLVDRMYLAMHDHEGVGLAATQIGSDLNLFVLSSYVFMNEEEKKIAMQTGDMGANLVVINPQVISESEDQVMDYEGCLSFPEVYIKVKRPTWVKISAQNVHGHTFELEGSNFGARAILHEMDHLKGKVMTDHLSYISKTKALNKHRAIQKSIQAKEAEEKEKNNNNPLLKETTKTSYDQTKKTQGKGKNQSKNKKNRIKKKKRV